MEGTIAVNDVITLARRISAGDINHKEARRILDRLAKEDVARRTAGARRQATRVDAALEAEADAALRVVDRR